jgi:hypothetical protein
MANDSDGIALPKTFSPAQVAERLNCSERTLRTVARRTGCCSIIGKNMVFTVADVEDLLQATKPVAVDTLTRMDLKADTIKRQRTKTRANPKIEPLPFRRKKSDEAPS